MVYSSVAKLRKLQAQVEAFWSEKGIADEAKQTKSYKFAHFWVLVLKSFGRNRCPVRAGALAYTTLLALIPLLAVAAGVSTALLRNQGTAPIQKLIDKLVENVAPQLGLVSQGADARQKITSHIWTYIQNVNSGTLGATGMIGLVLAAILLFTTVEETFNDIWGITRGRSWYLRIVQYWAGLTLGPLLLATVLLLTTGPHLNWTKSVLEEVPVLGTLFYAILPFLIVSAVFTFCYRFLPNTKVRWEAALVGGVVGGSLWQMNNVFSVFFVSRVLTYKAIYQGFAIVPVFMFGLYMSWLILLFGAQVAYAYQNRRTYIQEKQAERVNQRGREFIALRSMTLIAQKFQSAAEAPTVPEIADTLGAPSRVISQVLHVLVQNRLLSEVADAETRYAPARPLDRITAHDILSALRAGLGQDFTTKEEPLHDVVRGEFERVEQAEAQVASSITLHSLVEQTGSTGKT